uniref:SWIB domain-containing protein n=1 Tax=Brassica oleracea var. oleracea TaxID=109376 RepID=A0A0D3BLF3_BRAOL
MALSSGIFSTVLCAKTIPFRTSPSLSLFPRHPDNLRMVRAVTVTSETAASEPATIKTREPRGIKKPRPVSPEMKDVVGESDPQNKKVIICDEKLKKIFEGKDRVGFLEIAKLIGPHFL